MGEIFPSNFATFLQNPKVESRRAAAGVPSGRLRRRERLGRRRAPRRGGQAQERVNNGVYGRVAGQDLKSF